MKLSRGLVSLGLRLSLFSAIFGTAGLAIAQTANSQDQQVVALPKFNVDVSQDTGYIGTNSLGATRAAIPVVDMPQSVVVITRQLINDTAAYQLSDVTRLVSGMTDGWMPNQDGLGEMFRGFTPKVSTDGFVDSIEGTEDLADIARVEVFKGPSSILLTQGGSSGGVINQITKSPLSTPQGYLKVQAGIYDANRVEADSTGPVPGTSGKLLYRIVLMDQDAQGYTENSPKKASMIAPSFTYKFSNNSSVTFKYNWYISKELNNVGQPENTSNLNIIQLYPVPRTRTTNDPNDEEDLHRDRYELTYNVKLNDHYRLSLGGDYANLAYIRQASRPSGSGTPSSPIVLPDGTVPRKWQRERQLERDSRVFVDNVVGFTKGSVDNTTIFGAEALQYRQDVSNSGFLPMPPMNLYAPAPSVTLPTYYSPMTPSSDQRNGQAYLMDMLKLFNNRVLISGGGTRHWFETGSWNSTLNGFSYKTGKTDTYQYGIIYRPVKGVSLYYSYNENFNPQFTELGQKNPDGTVTDIGVAPPQMTTDKEVGAKLLLLNQRLSATVDYYDESLTNRTQYILETSPSLYSLVGGGTSKGWEADVFYNPTPNWSIVASGALIRAVDQNGIQLNYTGRKTLAFLTRYDFRRGLLKGLGVSISANYVGPRVIYYEFSSSHILTMGGRTLWNAALFYSFDRHYELQLNVNNIFDKWYLVGGFLPQRVYIGDGTNVIGSITYRF